MSTIQGSINNLLFTSAGALRLVKDLGTLNVPQKEQKVAKQESSPQKEQKVAKQESSKGINANDYRERIQKKIQAERSAEWALMSEQARVQNSEYFRTIIPEGVEKTMGKRKENK